MSNGREIQYKRAEKKTEEQPRELYRTPNASRVITNLDVEMPSNISTTYAQIH